MKNKKGSGQLWGMILYEMTGDGTLNGLWTNTFTGSKKVMSEIARKKGEGNRQEIPGEYYVSWIEDRGGPVSGTLKIEARGNHYYLEWIISGKLSYKGVGMLLAERQLAVTYWDGEGLILGGESGNTGSIGGVGGVGGEASVSGRGAEDA